MSYPRHFLVHATILVDMQRPVVRKQSNANVSYSHFIPFSTLTSIHILWKITQRSKCALSTTYVQKKSWSGKSDHRTAFTDYVHSYKTLQKLANCLHRNRLPKLYFDSTFNVHLTSSGHIISLNVNKSSGSGNSVLHVLGKLSSFISVMEYLTVSHDKNSV
jgi:hypothetical protein